jgi:hypothetical protein
MSHPEDRDGSASGILSAGSVPVALVFLDVALR